MALEQDQRITEVVKREQSRLSKFIRRRVPDPRDAEDILQDVFYELVEANRLLMPIEHITAWLFRVARNRITDLFRKKKPESFGDIAIVDENGEPMQVRKRCTRVTCCSMNSSWPSRNCLPSSETFLWRTNLKAAASRRSAPAPE